MKQQRRFAIAPSFVRLVRRERPGVRIVEGHFPDQPERRSHVRLEGERCELVLETLSGGAVVGEERAEVSRGQGEVLLDVCEGKVTYERIRLDAGEGPIMVVDRYLSPSTAGVVRIVFDGADEAKAFKAPPWCGPELGAEDVIEPRALALGARPKLYEGPIQDSALESLLDLLDSRAPRYAGRGRDDAVLSALKRLARNETAAPQQSAPAPQPAPAKANANGVAAASPSAQAAQAAAPAQPAANAPGSAAEDALFEPMEPTRPAKPGNGSAERAS
jgi:CYTH domain-containing protein